MLADLAVVAVVVRLILGAASRTTEARGALEAAVTATGEAADGG